MKVTIGENKIEISGIPAQLQINWERLLDELKPDSSRYIQRGKRMKQPVYSPARNERCG